MISFASAIHMSKEGFWEYPIQSDGKDAITFGTLFSGGGGFDIGAMMAGGKPAFAIEYRADIAAVYRQNLGNHITVYDILKINVAIWLKFRWLKRVDLLHVSPPCPNFSNAKAGGEETKLDIALARKLAEFIHVLRPRFFTLENVYKYRLSQSWQIIAQALHDCGYKFNYWHLMSADYDAPQTRQRMIVIARNDGVTPSPPTAVRAKEATGSTLFGPGLDKWLGWHEAIEDLTHALPDSEFADWQKARLPKEYVEFLTDCTNAGRNFTQRQPDEPAPTITTELFRRPSTAPKALLLSKDKGDYSDGHAVEDEPAKTVTANDIGRRRALLVEGDAAGQRPLTVKEGGQPSFTVKTSGGGRVARAVVPLSVLVGAGNTNIPDAQTAKRYTEAEQPAPTVLSKASPTRMRAMILGNGTRSGAQTAVEPCETITANRNQVGVKVLLVSGGNATGVAMRDEDAPAPTIGDTQRVGNMPRAFITNGVPTSHYKKIPTAFLMDAANPHSNGQIKHRLGDEPTKTITASDSNHKAFVLWRVVRMTARCLARFQTFPDWYQFPTVSDKKAARRLANYTIHGRPANPDHPLVNEHIYTHDALACEIIGNAVPPLLAYHIVRSLLC